MALIRCLVGATLVCALAAGCNQSLFDADPGGGGDPGGDGDPDGSPAGGDGGAGIPDASPGNPDAGGDSAVGDFAMDQDGPWRYVEIQPGPYIDDTPMHMPMTYGAWDQLQGWVGVDGDGAPRTTIAHCPSNPEHPQCQGLGQRLVLASASRSHLPAVLWTAPRAGVYRVRGDLRIPDGADEGVAGSLVIARNDHFDGHYYYPYNGSTAAQSFDVEIEVLQGDTILLTAIPRAVELVPLGVSLTITERDRAATCQMAALFEGGTFPNRCGDGGMFTDGDTTQDADPPPPPEVPGSGRKLVEGAVIEYQGTPNDYGGDWTLQFWAYLAPDSAQGTPRVQTVLSDLDCASTGGIEIRHDNESLTVELGYEDEILRCVASPLRVISDPLTLEEWHFFRIVRDTAGDTLSMCVDGKHQSQVTLPGDAPLTTVKPLEIGRDISTTGFFLGQLADLRMYGEALPCPSAP